jgi:hypothetical protein
MALRVGNVDPLFCGLAVVVVLAPGNSMIDGTT